MGSPPLARGKCLGRIARHTCTRLTPACAGKITSLHGRGGCFLAHPRLRGENACLSVNMGIKSGSPPLARGKSADFETPSAFARLTPACAGKISMRPSMVLQRSAHPRLRGENPPTLKRLRPLQGSPPLARGKCFQFFIRQLICRLTPACAGKITCASGTSQRQRAHPRLRGENKYILQISTILVGSPPLARGK